ncbi:MAG TPA: hypothetical protein VMW72_03690 [Sedimentisphaerales bacterium]|nr:hypothetical protein [Sedimentisphaerales bacterium]
MQNKPNFQKSQMNLNIYTKMAYDNKSNWALGENKPNQTQFKPKTNPISKMPEMNVNIYYITVYNNKTYLQANTKQTQTNPIQTQFPKRPKMNLKLFAGKSSHTPLGCENKFFDMLCCRRYILNKFTNHTNIYVIRQGVKK